MYLKDILNALLKNAFEHELQGFDPYDGLFTNNFLASFLKKNSIGRLLLIHLNKRSIFNLRPIIGINMGVNPKAVALYLSGCIKCGFNDKLAYLKNLLIQTANHRNGSTAWGYYFPWQSRAFFLSENTPAVVATSFAANSLLDLFEENQDRNLIECVKESINYLINHLNKFEDESGICFSYSSFDHSIIYNASALGLELMARYIYLSGGNNPEMQAFLEKGIAFIVDKQNEDGSWYYGQQLRQHFIDHYHTAYILESLQNIDRYTGKKFNIKPAIQKVLNFYINNMITEEGAPKYFKNAIYPIESHCSGAAIKALCVLSEEYGPYLFDLAVKVADWTIKNMYDERNGYFYYKKRKFWTNKINYLRWSQAWMFIGLSYLHFYGKKYGYSFK